MPDHSDDPLLRAENLTKRFETSEGFLDRLFGSRRTITAVDGVDLEVREGETLAVVGESGCGKSTLGRTLLGLEEPTEGTVSYRGTDLSTLSTDRLREIRTDLGYVFQDPLSSLDPRMTIAETLAEPLEIHGLASGEEKARRVDTLLETVGLSVDHAHRYPHELSGGQRQRVGIARALAVEPDVLVCDEPVSALDVNVQAQILDLLADLQAEYGLSYLLIAHDLRVVEHLADRVAVMYLGEFVEVGSTESVYRPPSHPYTEALFSAIPEPDPGWDGDRILLSGSAPSPTDPPSGCRFHTRCPRVIPPEWYDGTDPEWRSLLGFVRRLEAVDSIESITTRADDRSHASDSARTNESDRASALERAIRESFDLPSDLSDPDAERRLTNVFGLLHEGDIDGARGMAQQSFRSPCERLDPELAEIEDGHRVSCLLSTDELERR